jgi:hypothetical protein
MGAPFAARMRRACVVGARSLHARVDLANIAWCEPCDDDDDDDDARPRVGGPDGGGAIGSAASERAVERGDWPTPKYHYVAVPSDRRELADRRESGDRRVVAGGSGRSGAGARANTDGGSGSGKAVLGFGGSTDVRRNLAGAVRKGPPSSPRESGLASTARVTASTTARSGMAEVFAEIEQHKQQSGRSWLQSLSDSPNRLLPWPPSSRFRMGTTTGSRTGKRTETRALLAGVGGVVALLVAVAVAVIQLKKASSRKPRTSLLAS